MSERDLSCMTRSLDETTEAIREMMVKGDEIRNLRLEDRDDLENAERGQEKWDTSNMEKLRELFTDGAIADEYGDRAEQDPTGVDFDADVQNFLADMDTSILWLQSLMNDLEELPECEIGDAGSGEES
jgi:hypothetical protein